MPYTTKAAKLTTYQGEEPVAAGVVLSLSGDNEEALAYQFSEAGTIGIPTGTITAIKSLGGVETGYLAEDGTEKNAVIKFIINTRVIWAGELCKSTAGDGTAVTELNYPDIPDIEVEAGDILFISMLDWICFWCLLICLQAAWALWELFCFTYSKFLCRLPILFAMQFSSF